MRKELWFGFTIIALILIGIAWFMPSPAEWTNGHFGLLMLALIVVAIMLGFPTAFTLMGMGMIFGWIAFNYQTERVLDLMVQRAYGVMNNDVLIAVPLFVFMGYLVERANLIEKLFHGLHLATARVPGSLAVATLITCTVFATATGIVGAVVTLMGLLAFPAMLRHGYNVKLSAGVITAGGCLGIIIPPSVLLILYGATAGVSVVQLYAGAFFPGIMLATLYVVYVILLAKLRPDFAPPLGEAERRVDLPQFARAVSAEYSPRALPGLARALKGGGNADAPAPVVARNLFTALLPALVLAAIMATIWSATTAPVKVADTAGLVEMGQAPESDATSEQGLAEPPSEQDAGVEEPPAEGGAHQGSGLQEPPAAEGAQAPAISGLQEPPGAAAAAAGEASGRADASSGPAATSASTADGGATPAGERVAAPMWFWIALAAGLVALAVFYWIFDFVRLEIFKMLLGSFFPLAILILAVLGTIVFGLATPTEAAAVGALGGVLLAIAYRQFSFAMLKESVFLTAKTSAMVCWLFVGSAIFSASFALLGGQELIEKWVLSLNMSPLQFMLLAQAVIFLLGWPLEWTEIIVIFMPIFIPLLAHFQIDPLFFGLLVALNLQTAFLSPPVAMAAFYLKGVSPPHVSLNQIFAGMLPFMAIQVIAMFLLYMWPQIGLWLPQVLYR